MIHHLRRPAGVTSQNIGLGGEKVHIVYNTMYCVISKYISCIQNTLVFGCSVAQLNSFAFHFVSRENADSFPTLVEIETDRNKRPKPKWTLLGYSNLPSLRLVGILEHEKPYQSKI